MGTRSLYLITGIMCFCISTALLLLAIMAGEKPLPFAFTFVSITVMCFCLAYLYPQFKINDERVKQIKQKGMYVSYFAILIYYFAFMTIVQFDLLNLSSMDILTILSSLTIVTVFLSWVILSHML